MSNDPQMALPQNAVQNGVGTSGQAGSFSPQEFSKAQEFNKAMGDAALETGNQASASPAAEPENGKPAGGGLQAIYDIPVNITVVLGRTHIEVSDLLALEKGDVVELDRKVGEAIDILVNNRLVARGEVVMVDDQLGITMTEIIKNNQAG